MPTYEKVGNRENPNVQAEVAHGQISNDKKGAK